MQFSFSVLKFNSADLLIDKAPRPVVILDKLFH